MPDREKADLILHPARMAVLEALAQRPMTTQELAQVLPGIPQPSLYRHLKRLMEAGMIAVGETRPVRGALEKVYRLEQSPHLSAEDLAGLDEGEHLHYFTMYAASLLQGFADYLDATPAPLDLLGDRVGYTEMIYYASREDLDEFLKTLQPALQKLASNPPGENRIRRKLAIISYPLPQRSIDYGTGN